MSSPDFCYTPPRPQLTIELVSVERPYECLKQSNFKIVSETKLTRAQLYQMWAGARLFGRGQEFHICGDVDNPHVITVESSPQLQLVAHPMEKTHWDYYVYEVYTRSDSSG